MSTTMKRISVALGASALLAPLAGAVPTGGLRDVGNGSFTRDFQEWTFEKSVSRAAVPGAPAFADYDIRVVDPVEHPQFDSTVAMIRLSAAAGGGITPDPCDDPSGVTPIIFPSPVAEARATTVMSQIVNNIRSTTFRFEVAAFQTINYSGVSEAISEMVVEVSAHNPGLVGPQDVHYFGLEILPSIQVGSVVTCDFETVDQVFPYQGVVFDLSEASFSVGDDVVVRVVMAVEVATFERKGLSDATIQLWIDNLRFSQEFTERAD